MKLTKIIAAIVTAFSIIGGCGVTAGAEVHSENAVLFSSRSVRVNSRDWSKYTTPTAKAKLSTAERAFYERLDAECLKYLTGTDDAESHDEKGYYTAFISFNDLGLNDTEAIEVEKWFKRNNPQYYFITTSINYYPGKSMQIKFQDFAVDGEKRAEITNEMFNKLDSWIASCSDAVTVWQKVIAINRKICESTMYDPRVTEDDDTYAAGKNQSMYSVLMTDETVCSGYSLTFSAMAHALGIDSLRAYNQSHGWNAVKFDDGNYYFVDVTWNDLDNGYSEYMEKYIGFGKDSAKVFDSEDSANLNSHSLSSYVEKWLPAISKGDYKVSDSDRSGRIYAPGLNAARIDDGRVMFWWDAVNSAASYEFQISYEEDFLHSGKNTFDTDRRECIYNLSSGNDTYYARIRAVDGHGNKSGWATVSYNNNNPVTTTLKSPGNANGTLNAGNEGVTFTWDSVSGADKYDVQISYDPKFANPIEKTVPKNDNSISVATSDDVNAVYFRVRAVNGRESSDWKSTMVKIGTIENNEFPRGDVDGSGKTTASDITKIIKHLIGTATLTSEEYVRADVNGNSKVNAADVTEIIKILVQMA